MGEEIPKANWEQWAHMLTAKLGEAVLLSLDMEPNPPALKRSYRPEKYNAPGTDFERRLQIALSHVEAGTLPLEHGPIVFSRDAHKVKLHTFEAWARSVGWVLPESFPKAIEQAAPAQTAATTALVVAETKERREDRRLKACETFGLIMPTSHKGRLPDGVGDVADHEGVTRQAFSTDVKAALKRRETTKREGATVHRA